MLIPLIQQLINYISPNPKHGCAHSTVTLRGGAVGSVALRCKAVSTVAIRGSAVGSVSKC